MIYIRKNRKGLIAETVLEEFYTDLHEQVGKWTFLTKEEYEAELAQQEIIKEELKQKKAERANLARVKFKAAQERKKKRKESLEAEFEAFKAWKASQNGE